MDMCGATLHPCGSKYISGGMPKFKVLWLGNLLMIDGATSREVCWGSEIRLSGMSVTRLCMMDNE